MMKDQTGISVPQTIAQSPAGNIAGTPRQEMVILGQATAPSEIRPTILRIGNVEYDISPLNTIFDNIATGAQMASVNPLDPNIIKNLQNAQRMMLQIRKTPLPSPLINFIAPFAAQLDKMQHTFGHMLKLRRELGFRMAQQPLIGIPLNLTLTPGSPTSADIVVQNPYIGSGGPGQNSIWGVTAFETPAGENISGLALLQRLQVAGHDYVAAALQGIASWPGNTGRMNIQGFPLWCWSLSKIFRAGSEWRPWNLGGQQGIVGAIMRETGNIIMRFGWAGGVGTAFNDSLVIWVRASPCGGIPFNVDDLRRAIVPLHQQAHLATQLAVRQPNLIVQALTPNLNATLRGTEAFMNMGEADLTYTIPDDWNIAA